MEKIKIVNQHQFRNDIKETVDKFENKDWSLFCEVANDNPNLFYLISPTDVNYKYDGIAINCTGGTSAVELKSRTSLFDELFMEIGKWNNASALNEIGIKYLYINFINDTSMYMFLPSRLPLKPKIKRGIEIYGEKQDRLLLPIKYAYRFEKMNGHWILKSKPISEKEYEAGKVVLSALTQENLNEIIKKREYKKWIN